MKLSLLAVSSVALAAYAFAGEPLPEGFNGYQTQDVGNLRVFKVFSEGRNALGVSAIFIQRKTGESSSPLSPAELKSLESFLSREIRNQDLDFSQEPAQDGLRLCNLSRSGFPASVVFMKSTGGAIGEFAQNAERLDFKCAFNDLKGRSFSDLKLTVQRSKEQGLPPVIIKWAYGLTSERSDKTLPSPQEVLQQQKYAVPAQ